MGVTYTSAEERGRLRGTADAALVRNQLVLTTTSLVALLAIVLCYWGRMADRKQTAPDVSQVVNLSDETNAETLAAALTPAFDNVADRRFAARELLRALETEDGRHALPNVGAIARLAVPSATVERARRLTVFAERLQAARERAAAAKSNPPATVPLFTTADVSAVKPALVVRTLATHRRAVLWCTIAFLSSFHVVSFVWWWRRVPGDRILLCAAHLLTTLGFLVMLSRPDPLRDSLLLVRYTQGVVVALGVGLALSMVNVRTAAFLRLSYLSLTCAVALSIVLIVFGSGPGTSGAKVNLGPVQPVELIRLLIVLFLVGYLGRRWELVRQLRETGIRGRRVPDWLDLPRLDHVLPVFAGVGISLVLFFALRDLGPALLLSLIFLAMLAVARARITVVAMGVAVLIAGFYGGYWLGLSRTLTARVGMWQSPWNNGIRGGDQIAQAIWAMATGALRGTGLGLGDTRYVPAGHTDLILAAVGEELGAIGILVALAAFGVVAWRGLRIARKAGSDTGVFLAVAMTLTLVAPMLVMAAGILGLIPLTGVVTPFMSYGGSAMLANFAALGLLAAVASDRVPVPRAIAETTPFRAPIRWVAATLTVAATIVLVAWGRVQGVAADRYLVKPQLSVQADGGLRYQYNPRVVDVARELPRGTVFDRRDIPVAGELGLVRAAEREYTKLHVGLREACPRADERCYPFGGTMFHLLGNANTAANWAASNTSYVERDEEDRLRGFNDRAAAVRVQVKDEDDEGTAALALRRDYRDLVPLVRHRWDRTHPSVQALLNRPKDLRLTIDARLQEQVATVVARAAAANGVQHAAAVVVDATTGELLASVSYPWPDGEMTSGPDAADALLDRARYGLYPPGSTFKLVTAAAALRLDPASSQMSFTCSRLSGDRVGAKIPGFARPVRDDVLDRHPHGTLRMHDGIVHSCNAYFAQLAVRIGAPALAGTAAMAGISYPTDGPPDRVQQNLPYSGYGQGDVLASPLRMARLAAGIATDGMIREPSIVRQDTPPAPKPFLSEASSRLLSGFMRDVVSGGTGHLLANHPVRIAGKTGTAEVDGAKSHSWFIGFAPVGPAARRIAFAVILENAGYGGAGAASVAGQVVSAASSLGVIK